MKLSPAFWVMRFVWVAVWMSLGLTIAGGLGLGFWYPASRWLFADGWQWMPFSKWLTVVLGAAPIGIMIGGFVTLYEWLQRTETPFLKKTMIGMVVVFFLVVVVMDKGIDGVHEFVKWVIHTNRVSVIGPTPPPVLLTRETGARVHASFLRSGGRLNVGCVEVITCRTST